MAESKAQTNGAGTGKVAVNGSKKAAAPVQSYAIERFQRDEGPWHQPFDSSSTVPMFGDRDSSTRRNDDVASPASVHQGSQAPERS
ncbi:hypothetical protein E4U21_006525 [Claviceps maximensis]|nr:hypothetical protein E4U21_006525 [Claviceps maximensis]